MLPLLISFAVLAQTAPAPSASPERATLAREQSLIRQAFDAALAVAKTSGCREPSQCRALPMGERPCGGPMSFVIYCSKSTDEAALKKKIDSATAQQRQVNEKYGLTGACTLESPPVLELREGECRRQPSAEGVLVPQ